MRRLGIRSKTVSVVYWLDLHCTALDGASEALGGHASTGSGGMIQFFRDLFAFALPSGARIALLLERSERFWASP